MTSVYVLKEVESIKKIAKTIFGDIVHKVYYAESTSSHGNMANTIACIDREIAQSQKMKTSIDQSGRNIVIEFVNGHKVFFSNSEWGEMEKFEFDKNVVII